MPLTAKANTLCFFEIMKEYTDSDNPLNMGEILDKMKTLYGLNVGRRTIYSCVDVLSELGYNISLPTDNGVGYYLEDRDFDVSEVRLLMDSVYSNPTITKSYSMDLIGKLQNLLPKYRRHRYANLFILNNGKKTDNKQVFLSIEEIDEAIIKKQKVSFTYLKYDFDKSQKPRTDKPYIVSPFAMAVADEHYYLLGKCESHNNAISHFRVDKIKDIEILDEAADNAPEDFSLAAYTDRAVLMYGGEVGAVRFRCDDFILEQVIDKFGRDVVIKKNADATFDFVVEGTLGGLLFWSLNYPDYCEILEPTALRKQAIDRLRHNKYGV